MNDRNRRSAAEVMANAARVVKAAVNIVRAAIAGGLHGAAAAAAKELLPTIIKLAVGVLIAIIVIPMFVISAMPNMFFGYETSEKDPQITMREQALSIGGAYLSLEDFEKTQQDAIITGEAAAYENQGVTIDEIRVSSKFDEEDLCWYIAINSVAHKQDLSEMKPEEVQSLLISNLKHTTRLESSSNQTVLRIIFQPLDKDKLMDDLEFDEDAKTWAGALFETIYESDALNKYKDKFEPYTPSDAGDTGYTGPAESAPGGSGGGGGLSCGPTRLRCRCCTTIMASCSPRNSGSCSICTTIRTIRSARSLPPPASAVRASTIPSPAPKSCSRAMSARSAVSRATRGCSSSSR